MRGGSLSHKREIIENALAPAPPKTIAGRIGIPFDNSDRVIVLDTSRCVGLGIMCHCMYVQEGISKPD